MRCNFDKFVRIRATISEAWCFEMTWDLSFAFDCIDLFGSCQLWIFVMFFRSYHPVCFALTQHLAMCSRSCCPRLRQLYRCLLIELLVATPPWNLLPHIHPICFRSRLCLRLRTFLHYRILFRRSEVRRDSAISALHGNLMRLSQCPYRYQCCNLVWIRRSLSFLVSYWQSFLDHRNYLYRRRHLWCSGTYQIQ